MHAKLSMEGELAYLAVDFIDSEIRHRQQIHEFGLVLMMSLMRLVAGRRVCPVWVGFRHNRTEDLDGFERFFGCPVNFGQPKTSIVLKRDLLGLPSKPVDERLLRILKGHCQEALGRRGEAVSLKDELAYLVASHLHAGPPNIRLVARELGLSERTMARRLAGQGTSFGRIVDKVRLHLAMRYLDEPNIRASQVAYLLGYSEPSAFNHAFRRWTGVSPSEYLVGP
jgi:AraC-like DNA-binding protein